MTVEYGAASAALDRAYGVVGEFAARLSRSELLAFSGCSGWTVADVLFHLLCDAQRALVALASPAPGPPDRTFVTYWTGFAAGDDDAVASAWAVRRSAAALSDGVGVVALWQKTAPAAVRAAGRADPAGCITTPGRAGGRPTSTSSRAPAAFRCRRGTAASWPAAPGDSPC